MPIDARTFVRALAMHAAIVDRGEFSLGRKSLTDIAETYARMIGAFAATPPGQYSEPDAAAGRADDCPAAADAKLDEILTLVRQQARRDAVA